MFGKGSLACLSILDKSKYGFRMLQQMGWQEGKGLGAKEDGAIKHVKISKKRDNTGVCVCCSYPYHMKRCLLATTAL